MHKDWADKYIGEFDKGWDQVRDDTLKRQIDNHVVPKNTRLADKAVGWVDSDPRRTLDFRLHPDSPAFRNGFCPIAVDKIGPRELSTVSQVLTGWTGY